MKKRRFNWRNHLATIAGFSTAIATAWLTIDWTTFSLEKDYPKLILSAVIAAGGYFTSFVKKDKGPDINSNPSLN